MSDDTTPELVLLTGHSDDVVSLTFSPDGKTLATASYDRSVILWDVETGKIIRTLTDCGEALNSVSFSPDGTTLATAGWGGTRLWDTDSGVLIRQWEDRWGSLLFCPDGRLLQVADHPGELVLVDPGSGSVSPVWKEEEQSVESFTVSPDGRLVVVASWEVVYVVEICTGKCIAKYIVPPERLTQERVTHASHNAVAISTDGTLVAVAGFGATRLWKIDCENHYYSLQHKLIDYHSVAFSPDNTTIATGDSSLGAGLSNGTLAVWDVETGKLLYSVPAHGCWVRCIAYSPDGSIIATGGSDASVKLWDSQNGELLRSLGGCHQEVFSLTFSPDGKTLSSGHGDATVRTWSLETFSLIETETGFKSSTASTVISLDGKTLATLTGDENDLSVSVEIRDTEQNKLLHTLALSDSNGKLEEVMSVMFSHDGTMIALGHLGFVVSIWNAQTGNLINWMRTSGDSVRALVFSPNGKTLAVGTDYDHKIELFNVSNGRCRRRLLEHTNNINALAYSLDGRILASASADGSVRLWNPGSGKLLATLVILPAASSEEVSNEWIAYTPEGYYDCSPGAERYIRWQSGTEILTNEVYEGLRTSSLMETRKCNNRSA